MSENAENSGAAAPVLEAAGIRKSFASPDGSSIEILKGASLRVNEGESVALRGESGAGKTTFMNILSGFENPTSGEVRWAGKRIDGLSNSAQARLRAGFMGFVFQQYCLLPELTALENVELSSRILGRFDRRAKSKAKDLLERVGLKDRIARAVMNSPKVLLADEPTGNLDEDTAKNVMEMMLGLCRENKAALMLITHNIDFAKMTDKEVFLSQGEITEIR